MSSSSYYKDEPVSDCRLEDVSTLLNLVSGSGRSSNPSPEKTHRQSQSHESTHVTVNMLDQLRTQLEVNIQNEIKLQVEQQLRKQLEGQSSSSSEQMTSLRRDLEEDREERKEIDQGFMESVEKLMQEIVQLGVKLLVLEERIEEVEKRSKDDAPPAPPIMETVAEPEPQSEPVVPSSSHPPLVDLTENEVVEMITDLSKDIQAKFIEFGESQATFRTKMQKMKQDMENNLFNEIFQVNLGISKLEDRIQIIEESKRPPSQPQPPPTALIPLQMTMESDRKVIHMITDLKQSIQTKFEEVEASQKFFRKMVEDANAKKDNQPGCNFVLLRPIEAVTGALGIPPSLQRLERGTPPHYDIPPPHPPPPSYNLTSPHPSLRETDVGEIQIVSVTGHSQTGILPGTSCSSGGPRQPPPPIKVQHGEDPTRQWRCLCGHDYVGARQLSNHIKYFTEKSWKWRCKVCKKRFPEVQQLKAHRKAVHKKTKLTTSATVISEGGGGLTPNGQSGAIQSKIN